jgi:hypothetical protein
LFDIFSSPRIYLLFEVFIYFLKPGDKGLDERGCRRSSAYSAEKQARKEQVRVIRENLLVPASRLPDMNGKHHHLIFLYPSKSKGFCSSLLLVPL